MNQTICEWYDITVIVLNNGSRIQDFHVDSGQETTLQFAASVLHVHIKKLPSIL